MAREFEVIFYILFSYILTLTHFLDIGVRSSERNGIVFKMVSDLALPAAADRGGNGSKADPSAGQTKSLKLKDLFCHPDLKIYNKTRKKIDFSPTIIHCLIFNFITYLFEVTVSRF